MNPARPTSTHPWGRARRTSPATRMRWAFSSQDVFADRISTQELYSRLNQQRLVHLLRDQYRALGR